MIPVRRPRATRSGIRPFVTTLLIATGLIGVGILASLRGEPTTTTGVFAQYGSNADHNPILSGSVGTWSSPPLRGRGVFEVAYDPTTHLVLTETMTAHHGWLYALNAGTGRIQWAWHAPNQLMATPILNPSGTIVFVGWGNGAMSNVSPHSVGNAFLVRGSGSSGVAAVTAQTGQIRWHHTTHGAVMPTLTYADGWVYVATGNRHLDSWNAQTGQEGLHQWVAGFDSMSATPITPSGLAIVPTMAPAAVWGIAVPSGAIRWVTANPVWTGGLTDTNPLIHGQTVWLSTLTTPLTVKTVPIGATVTVSAVELNTRTGQIVRQIALGQGHRPIHTETGNYTWANGRLYLTSPVTDTLYALNPATGRVLWEFEPRTPIRAGVLVWHNHCYVPTGHTLWVLNARTGTIQGSQPFAATVTFGIDSPILVGDHLILAVPGPQTSHVVSLPVQANGMLTMPSVPSRT
ncbi:Outer membrane protein assembly factor BamB, contains PQQ-like beta-propeller repeat [Sulfobacillus thermosulfidooxidans DSM 9293]|uniref:Outer membrane protein assembly factor BamB, contains PQQ-like beta-propeller repeat n=1 Tax=Sulfobacillus thermosulfidooxidans (strain DSM 9293 / VKM B-1269 / AT-1) TaxID=929705 RepID=A0A1W1W6Z1_SULTA|nr:PQQ-binding-like beta-propeller repeat protein [Sulfobacillus thermosulfidooxidans]SMC02054.1 Outer membrane protein assembly factor BamB, contains PQQ-like beta-propeller repeat [Sulfobacillus thermosulfidooxidans DSM 9293]